MKVEYVPTIDDVYRLKVALGRPLRRQPLLWVFVLGPAVVAAGAALMAVTGAWLWWGLALLGAGLSGLTWAALWNVPTTLEQVRREYAQRAWLRTPYRLELSDQGVSYQHGPYRSRAGWSAFAGVAETDSHFILLEKGGPTALAYGVAKRELEKAEGVAAWRDFISSRVRSKAR